MSVNGDRAAFPISAEDEQQATGSWGSAGLTKREYFAAAALQGLAANPYVAQYGNGREHVDLTEQAVRMADDLIYELEQVKP